MHVFNVAALGAIRLICEGADVGTRITVVRAGSERKTALRS
jgi:hypothetical protein